MLSQTILATAALAKSTRAVLDRLEILLVLVLCLVLVLLPLHRHGVLVSRHIVCSRLSIMNFVAVIVHTRVLTHFTHWLTMCKQLGLPTTQITTLVALALGLKRASWFILGFTTRLKSSRLFVCSFAFATSNQCSRKRRCFRS